MVHNTQQGRRAAKRPGAGRRAGGKVFRGSPLKLVLGLLELPNRVSSVALAESEDERRNPESIWSLANWWGEGRILHSTILLLQLRSTRRKRRIVESIRLWREEDQGAGVGSGPWSFAMPRPLRPRAMFHPILSGSLARRPIWYAVHFCSPTAMSFVRRFN